MGNEGPRHDVKRSSGVRETGVTSPTTSVSDESVGTKPQKG